MIRVSFGQKRSEAVRSGQIVHDRIRCLFSMVYVNPSDSHLILGGIEIIKNMDLIET